MVQERADPGGALVVLNASRRRWSVVFALCALMTAANVWVARQGATVGVGGAAFFGACALASGLQLVPGVARLEIGRDGFAFRSLLRNRTFAWTEVGPFSVATSSGVTFVVFDRLGGESGWRALANTALVGKNDALPDTYGVSPGVLAARMNAAREAALRAHA